ncbi:MAG: helicase C-terminal domain-containing protein [Nitrospirota bacterium]
MEKLKVEIDDIALVFNILEKRLPNYESREQQIKMANAVWDCLQKKKRLLVEAGTGVGKSFAYLIPAILSKEKTIVSTASIALQDQLANKDLIFLQQALPQKFSFAILKGKNNYLCLKREREFVEISDRYNKFKEWVSRTNTGDKEELHFLPDFWSKVCGDSDDCNAARCPYYRNCFYYRHYRSLYKKDILVVNHHLLIFDLLSEFNLLPFHDRLIIDEAHQIDDVISHVMGNVLSHSRLVWLLYRLRGLRIAVDHIFEPVESFFKSHEIPSHAAYPVLDDIRKGLMNLKSLLALDKVVERLAAYHEEVSDDELTDKIQTTKIYVSSIGQVIDDFINQKDNDRVYYMTGNKGYFELKSSLVESRKPFSALVNAYEGVTMTSATLTTDGKFRFLKERLGITDFEELVIGSPFDYRKQALLYLDKELPPPDKEMNEPFMKKGIKVIERLIHASEGRALVLFTSYKHLNYASEHITIDYPYKSQGKMPPARLIQWFRKTPHAVLLATATFWQGIDIKGEDLSLVIIVKMPFGSPGDPVYDERCRRLAERWFNDLALPSAILMLRQGFGRLIRSTEDYGVVAILDSRLLTSSYRNTILSSLPEMRTSHNLNDVQIFFDSIPRIVTPKHEKPLTVYRDRKGKKVTGSNECISRVVALGNSGSPSAISELINCTREGDGNVRRLAASALGKLVCCRPEIYGAVQPLEELLLDSKPQVRNYALKALGRIGRFDHKKIQSILNNPEEKEYNISLAMRLVKRRVLKN